MATSDYITGRKKYGRPQAILFSDNPGTLTLDINNKPIWTPIGMEVNSSGSSATTDSFLILSDHNRQGIDFKPTRIEKRERTINGRMRSYHIADKMTLSTSWSDLPSRAFDSNPEFDANGNFTDGLNSYTVDGGAGGNELLDWYNSHTGSFYMFLAYDNKNVFGTDDNSYNRLNQYQQVLEVFFSDFSYNVKKRSNKIDFWDVSLSVEEA
jgi:hypothetical protein